MSATARIAEIFISAANADNADAWVLNYAVGEALRYARDEAGYQADELPPFAAHWLDTWEYAGKAGADGFVDLAPLLIEGVAAQHRIAEFLEILGLSRHRAVFDDLVGYQTRQGNRIAAQFERGDEELARSHYYPFMDRFLALERLGPAIETKLSAWIVLQDWLVIDPSIPDAPLENARRLIPFHPQKAQRGR